MTRSKELRATTPVRYRLKMYRLFSGMTAPDLAKEASDVVLAQWNLKFGAYHEAYLKMKQFLLATHPDLPKGQLGYYRSFLFRAMKQIPAGYDPEDLIEEFHKKLGLDPVIMREILDYFGLSYNRPREEATTNRG